jgi:integrase/recombinase XerC
VEDVDVYVLRAWLGTLARTLSSSSAARKVAAARALFRHLQRRDMVCHALETIVVLGRIHREGNLF